MLLQNTPLPGQVVVGQTLIDSHAGSVDTAVTFLPPAVPRHRGKNASAIDVKLSGTPVSLELDAGRWRTRSFSEGG